MYSLTHPSENLLMSAINLVKNYCSISKINTIKQAQKSILFHNGYLWTKRSKPEFNITMWAFDSADTCELVVILLLWWLRFIFNFKDTGLYRDDCVILLHKIHPQNIDKLRKELIKFFKDHKLNITITTNAKVINFLDVILDLNNDYSKRFTKVLYNHRDISKESNHHHKIVDNLHKSAPVRFSINSSNKEIFDNNKNNYIKALELLNNHKLNLEYSERKKKGKNR